MENFIIAIDGFSSTGKSSLAKELAKKYNFLYVDTGAMYRAVTYFALINNFINKQEFYKNDLIDNLSRISLKFKFNKKLGFSEIYLNNINIENQIRTLYVSNFVSKIAAVKEVRELLVSQQQKLESDEGIVMDGRDIGTVVYPKADVKLYLNCIAEVRARRRFEEMIEKGQEVTFNEVLANVNERDFIDTNRATSPLKKADDAIEIDNSYLTILEQIDIISKIIDDKLTK